MDHMRNEGIEPSSLILIQITYCNIMKGDAIIILKNHAIPLLTIDLLRVFIEYSSDKTNSQLDIRNSICINCRFIKFNIYRYINESQRFEVKCD